MDTHKELVKVRNALGGIVQSLSVLKHAADVLGMRELVTELRIAVRQLQVQQQSLCEISNVYVAEKFDAAAAASANVLHAALAGAEIASQIEAQRQASEDQFAEREMRDAMADWRQRSADI